MKTKTITRQKPESIINDAPKLHADFTVPSVAHQGDLILVALRKLPASAKPRSNRQLADGSTQGSRHILERGDVYDCYPDEIREAILQDYGVPVERAYIGPVFVSPVEPTCDDLAHPEHGNHGFPAGTVVATVYQRSLDAGGREARVRD